MTIDEDRVRRLNAAIMGIYAASLNEAAWREALSSIARLFDADAAVVSFDGGDAAQVIASSGYDPSRRQDCVRIHAHEEPPRIEGAGEGGPLHAQHAELARLLVPHLQQAIAMRRGLGGPWDRFLAARLESLGVGLALFDAGGRMIEETATFAHLASAAGLTRSFRQGPPSMRHPAVRALITRTIATRTSGCLVAHAGERGAVLIRCAPVPPRAGPERLEDAPGVMVTLELLDGAQERSIDAAAEMWSLSKREREFLRAAVAERSVARAAGALGVSHETARSHAKRVYAKAGVHSLAELLTAAAAVRIDGR